jgi:hypothetical protein
MFFFEKKNQKTFASMALVLLVLPRFAFGQFSLVVTQIGPDGEEYGDAYAAHCADDACRATLPVRIDRDWCVLNIRVGAPARSGTGRVILALGPCRSKKTRAISAGWTPEVYKLGQFASVSTEYDVPLDDPFDIAAAFSVRLDIIAARFQTDGR